MKKKEVIEKLIGLKADSDNTIDFSAYSSGLSDMYEYLNSVKNSQKIRVHYMTEFGGDISIVDLSELISFAKRFNVLSVNFLLEQNIHGTIYTSICSNDRV